MNKSLSDNQFLDNLIENLNTLKTRTPLVSDKFLLDLVNLVNSPQVSNDIHLSRVHRGLLGMLIDITGEQDRKKQLEIEENLIKNQELVSVWLTQTTKSVSFTQFALIVTQKHLKAIGFSNSELEKRVELLEKRIAPLEVDIELDKIINAWVAGEIYNQLPWVVQIAMLCRQACSDVLSAYELSTNDKKYRKVLVNKLITATTICANADDSIKGLQPNDCLSLTKLLESCKSIASKQNKDVLLAEILEPFWTFQSHQNHNIPYLISLWKTLELLNLPEKSENLDPVKSAIQISRKQTNSTLYYVKSLRNFVSVIVDETTENHLSFLRVFENQNKDETTQVSKPDSTHIGLKFERVIPSIPQFGLVLAGGGAKGAYEAGVLKYMGEIGLAPSVIAGTSIGAINGAVLASHQSFREGVEHVIALWKGIERKNVLIPSKDNSSLFDSEPLKELLRKEVDIDQLRKGTELWVATFSSSIIPNFDDGTILPSLIDICSSFNGKAANYYRVQDCKNDEILIKTLTASAAIPVAFPPVEINGQYHVDGFLGDNLPLKALAVRGCSNAIVIHLENGSLWSRYDFSGISIIEVRPKKIINESKYFTNGIFPELRFDSNYIEELIERGYNDGKYYIDSIGAVLKSRIEQKNIEQKLLNSTINLINLSDT